MRHMSMGIKSLCALPLLLLVGCSGSNATSLEKNCDSVEAKIVSKVLSDPELRKYARTHLNSNQEVVVIWEQSSRPERSCKAQGLVFSLASSSAIDDKLNRYVLITKMYYDDTAAFVEVSLPPTGKNGDLFLRNISGWKVTQRSFWER